MGLAPPSYTWDTRAFGLEVSVAAGVIVFVSGGVQVDIETAKCCNSNGEEKNWTNVKVSLQARAGIGGAAQFTIAGYKVGFSYDALSLGVSVRGEITIDDCNGTVEADLGTISVPVFLGTSGSYGNGFGLSYKAGLEGEIKGGFSLKDRDINLFYEESAKIGYEARLFLLIGNYRTFNGGISSSGRYETPIYSIP